MTCMGNEVERVRSIFGRRRKKVEQPKQEHFSKLLESNLDENLKNLKNMLDHPKDLIVRELLIGDGNQRCAVVYMEGIVDAQSIHTNILAKLQ